MSSKQVRPHAWRELQNRVVHDHAHPRGDGRPSKDGSPLGGDEKIVESRRDIRGRQGHQRPRGQEGVPKKYPVVALVERGSQATRQGGARCHRQERARERSSPKRQPQVDVDDGREPPMYIALGKEFYAHRRRSFTPSAQYTDHCGLCAYQHGQVVLRDLQARHHRLVSLPSREQHLQRYADEFAFRWGTRIKLAGSRMRSAPPLIPERRERASA